MEQQLLKGETEQQSNRKRIIFAMIEAGGGHRSPAVAVMDELKRNFSSECEVILTDFMKDTGCDELDRKHKQTWNYLLERPFICKSGHLLSDLAGPVFRAGLKQYLTPFYDHVYNFLVEFQPDIIFSTHPFNSIAIDLVRTQHNLNCILINFLTELFDVSSFWVLKDVDYYIVTSRRAMCKLVLRGIPSERLRLFDYPIRSEFLTITGNKSEMKKKLGIDPEKKTILMSFGRQGRADPDKYIDKLIRAGFPLNVILITGENGWQRNRLLERYRSYRNIIIRGYVTNFHEYMYASDFCFIKPGPSTTMEAIALHKPVIFYKSAQLSENANIRYCLKHKIGYYAGDNPVRFIDIVSTLISDSHCHTMEEHYSRLKIQNGAPQIASFIIDLLKA